MIVTKVFKTVNNFHLYKNQEEAIRPKKIAFFTSDGPMGENLIKAALRRGHSVTAVVPDKTNFKIIHPSLEVVKGNVMNSRDVKRYVGGCEVVIYAHEFTKCEQQEDVMIALSLIKGVNSRIKNLIVSGHGLLEPIILTYREYQEWPSVQHQQLLALSVIRSEPGLRWSYFYTLEPEPDGINSRFILGKDFVIASNEGVTKMPFREFSTALINEAEKRKFVWLEGEFD